MKLNEKKLDESVKRDPMLSTLLGMVERQESNGLVFIAYNFAQTTYTPQFGKSLLDLCMKDAYTTKRIVDYAHHEISGAHIPKGRNDNVRDFLDHPDKPEWLWMIDTDASFAIDTLDQLLASAYPKTRPIVGALAFGVSVPRGDDKKFVTNEVGGSDLMLYPTVYLLDDESKWRIVFDYPRNTLVPVNATGLHCMLIHRSVLADHRWDAKNAENIHPWFRMVKMNGADVSEDFFFCMKAQSMAYPVLVNTAIKTGHVKTFIADEDEYDRKKYIRQHWLTNPPPATEEVTVIVPVVDRPQNVKPFLDSLIASTGLIDEVIFVCGPLTSGEEREAIWAYSSLVVTITIDECERDEFAPKVNHAFRGIRTPWVFIAGDDVTFRPGWLSHAQHAYRTTGCDVIGTNDLGNPRVMNGQHATHPLIRTQYILERGASWDGPGIIAHEGYHHMCVDDEWTNKAKGDIDEEHPNGRFVLAHEAIVEHHHPLWGKGDVDAKYEKGSARFEEDRALFEERYDRFVRSVKVG